VIRLRSRLICLRRARVAAFGDRVLADAAGVEAGEQFVEVNGDAPPEPEVAAIAPGGPCPG
jgi:hypothetical protein